MKMTFKSLFLGSALILGTGAANAALIDFTADGAYDFTPSAVTGSTDGIGFSLTPNTSDLTLSGDGPGAIGPLTGDNDGVGIRDDEVTFPSEALTLTFDSAVTLNAVYFLDLFEATDDSDEEVANLAVDGSDATDFTAQVPIRVDPVGYGGFEGLSFSGTSFTFTALSGNDAVANPDFALAGVDITADGDSLVSPEGPSEVPLPAGILLLGGALAGAGLLRRRKA